VSCETQCRVGNFDYAYKVAVNSDPEIIFNTLEIASSSVLSPAAVQIEKVLSDSLQLTVHPGLRRT